MSGILTKAGVLGIVKLLFGIFGASVLTGYGTVLGLTQPGFVLVVLGAATFLIGEVQAYRQTDIKRLLAYSTLAQVGEIVMVVGVGTSLALSGGLVHVANHALMKTLLFFAAGAFIMRSGRQQLADLAGIGRKMPFTALTMGIGLIAIMGAPPFGGFVGKFLMIYACVKAGQIPVAVVMLAGSVIAAMYYARILRVVCFEPYNGPEVEEAPLSIRVVLGALAALIVVNGVWPQALLNLVQPIVAGFFAGEPLDLLPPLTMTWTLATLVATLGAFAVYFLGRGSAARSGAIAVATMVVTIAAVLAQADHYDGLSLAYALLIAAVGALNLMNSIGYMRHGHAPHRFFFFFLLMIAGLMGVTGAGNLFTFFAFWEVMSSWTLYLVTIHEETREAVREGTKYFVFNFAGACFLFLGVAMLAAGAGTFDMAALAAAVPDMSPTWASSSFGLMFIGFLMKAAQLPLRIDYQMHPVPAPTPVSGYISAVLLKVGPYGVLHFFALAGGGAVFVRLAGDSAWMPSLMTIVSVIAAVTVLYAGAMAVIENGIKRLLIYSTVSQLAYVLLAISIGSSLGVAGGLMHAFTHMLGKNTLFLVAGCILAQAHVTSLDELGGLAKRMPVTFALFLVAGLSVAGIPPLAGFSSKWLIYEAAFEGGHYVLALAALMSSLFTLAAVMKFAHAAFLGQMTPVSARMHEAPPVMLVPMAILMGVNLIVGALPGLVLVPIARIQTSLGLPAIEATWFGGLPGPQAWHPLALSLGLAAVALVAWLYQRTSVAKRQVTHVHSCGVTTIAPAALRVPATALYETPDHLLRLALRAGPGAETGTHD